MTINQLVLLIIGFILVGAFVAIVFKIVGFFLRLSNFRDTVSLMREKRRERKLKKQAKQKQKPKHTKKNNSPRT